MGMGYSAAWADVIDRRDVKKLCPREYRELINVIKCEGRTIEEIAQEYGWDNEIQSDDIGSALDVLCQAFDAKTGLSLSLCYYDPDKGDRYDTIDEAYWSVEGVYELTPAGKKYQDIIRRETYVIYG